MKFIISRTSVWDESVKPYEKAFRCEVDVWMTRTCSEEEFDVKFSAMEGKWRDSGADHHVTKEGYISKRTGKKMAWCIELDSLEDLIDLYNDEGALVVGSDYHATGMMYVEIYDDYRE